jgi:antitoxin HicB
MKDIEYYLGLPYTVILRPGEDGAFVARVDELPGCVTDGATIPEAVEKLEDLKRAWIEDAIEAGHQVPEPSAEEVLPSGKWVQRVPKSLHRKLTVAAKKEAVSLNSLVSHILSEAMGVRSGQAVEQSSVGPALEFVPQDITSAWHESYFNWVDPPSTSYMIVTNHSVASEHADLGLANRLQLLGTGFPKNIKKTFKVFHDEEKSQRFGKA